MTGKQFVSTAKKNSWLIIVSGILSSLVFTIWGGCLLLGCLLYLTVSKRMHKTRMDLREILLRNVQSR